MLHATCACKYYSCPRSRTLKMGASRRGKGSCIASIAERGLAAGPVSDIVDEHSHAHDRGTSPMPTQSHEGPNGVEYTSLEFDSRLEHHHLSELQEGSCEAAMSLAPHAGTSSCKLSSLCVYEGGRLQSLPLTASQWAACSLLQRRKQLSMLVQNPHDPSKDPSLEIRAHKKIMVEFRVPTMLTNEFIFKWLLEGGLLLLNGNEGCVLTCIDSKENSGLTRIFLKFQTHQTMNDEPRLRFVPSTTIALNTTNAVIGIQGLESRLGVEQQSLSKAKIGQAIDYDDADEDDDFYGGDNHQTIVNDDSGSGDDDYGDDNDDFGGGDDDDDDDDCSYGDGKENKHQLSSGNTWWDEDAVLLGELGEDEISDQAWILI